MSAIRKLILTVLIFLGNTCIAQIEEFDSCSNKTLQFINSYFDKEISTSRTRLFIKPLLMVGLKDSMLVGLVNQGKIKKEDVSYLMAQVNVPCIKQWDQAKIRNATIVKKIGRETYGISNPLFSKSGKLVIIYFRDLSRNSISEGIVVYELIDGKWEYSISLSNMIS